MSDELFLKIFNKEKIKIWSDNYLNYIMLSNQLIYILENIDKNEIDDIAIEDNKEDENEEIYYTNQNQVEINLTKLNILANNLIEEDKEKINVIEELDNNSHNQKKSICSLSEKEKKKYKKPTKHFISLLDREIKKIHIFYTTKETSLYEGINAQIRFFNNIKNKDNEENIKSKIKIISDLKYLSKLGKSLINYIYLNIRALKNILNIYDNKIMFISYRYIKKHLSKNNGDLIYILNFKILDESLIAIDYLFNLVKENLKKTEYFKNNKNKEQFNKDNDDIISIINDTDKIYEKIFDELVDWEKYLNMSLGLPSSSFKSVFKNTSFVGDSFLSNSSIIAKENSKIEFKKKKSIKLKINQKNRGKDNKGENLIISTNKKPLKLINIDDEQNNKNNINEDNINNINNINKDNEIIIKNDVDNDIEDKEKKESNEENNLELLESNSVKSSELFRETDINSYTTQKVLSKENLTNLKILLFLSFFYSFSVSYLIPKIIKYIYIKIDDNKIYLYGIIISIISIGNLFSKIFFNNCLKDSFKTVLLFSSFFMLLYYILLALGIFYEEVILIIIGRFFLGFTILKHLSKIYVNQYVPISNQIRANNKHKKYINIGFSFGILLNSLDILIWKNKVTFEVLNIDFDLMKIIIIICLLISLVIFIIIICHFKEPTKYALLHQLLIDINKRHRLSKAFLVQNEEKKNADKLDQDYLQVNESFGNQINDLDQLVQTHLDNSKYYRKIKFILFALLISAEYTRDNLLLLIPRLISYNINNNNNDIVIGLPIVYSICFFFSYLLQDYNLIHKKKKRRNLIIIQIFLFIFNISFYRIISGLELLKNDDTEIIIIPAGGIFLMTLLNEINHAIIINLFIKLLPSEEIKLCCFKISFAINFFTKIIKIVPALIIFVAFCVENDFNKKFLLDKEYKKHFYCNYILFGIQIFLCLFCFIICICCRSSLKRNYRNRILSLKRKKLNIKKK